MIYSSDQFSPSTMIMSEYLVVKFQSFILFLNKATQLSELSIQEFGCRFWVSDSRVSESPTWLWCTAYAKIHSSYRALRLQWLNKWNKDYMAYLQYQNLQRRHRIAKFVDNMLIYNYFQFGFYCYLSLPQFIAQ